MIVHATPSKPAAFWGRCARSWTREAPSLCARPINDVAKSATGAFDPQGFWLASERGSEITVDTFGLQWNFWAVVHEPLGTLRRRYGIPSLDPAVDATLALLEP